MMKRLVAVLFLLAVIALAVALVAPGFIDWSKHKDAIVAQVQSRTGREVRVAGAIAFRVLPQPQMLLEDVTIGNAPDMRAGHFLKLRRMEARVGLIPLLSGRVEVENVRLVDPELNLEVNAQGKTNWKGLVKEKAEGRSASAIAPDMVALEQVSVTGGSVHYANRATGVEWSVDGLNLEIAASSLLGPYTLRGDLRYRGTPAAIDLATGQYGQGAAMPLKFSFQPVDKLPQIVFDGALDMRQGLDVKGKLSIAQGSVQSLFDTAVLEKITFLKEEATLEAMLELKGRAVRLGDIRARFGAGTLSGAFSMELAPGGKPGIGMDLAGEDLVVTEAGASLAGLAADFEGPVKFTGKKIVYNGIPLDGVDFAAESQNGEWTVKQVRTVLAGPTIAVLAGVMNPNTETAAMGVEVQTADMDAFLSLLPLSKGNALRLLSGVKKANITASLDLEPGEITLSGINALMADKSRITGDMTLRTGNARPWMKTSLRIEGLHAKDFPVAGILGNITRADAGFDLDFTNFTTGSGQVISSMKITGAAEADGLEIKSFDAVLGEEEGFSLSGIMKSAAPLAGFDLEYSLRLKDGEKFARAFGITPPPLVRKWDNADLRGRVTGAADKYAFGAKGTVNGGEIDLGGGVAAGVYEMSVYMHRVEGATPLTDLSVEGLLAGPEEGFELRGRFSGTRESYELADIRSRFRGGNLTGSIARRDGKASANLVLDTIDLGAWTWDDWGAARDMTLTLSGKALVWRDIAMENPVLEVKAGPRSVNIPKLEGTLWGGTVKGSFTAEEKDGWRYRLKATLTGADLDYMAAAAGLPGLAPGRGDVSLDVKSDGEGFFGTLENAEGGMKISSEGFEILGFNPAAAMEAVEKGGAGADLQRVVGHSLKNKGAGVYGPAVINVTLAGGKAVVDGLTFTGDNHALTVGGLLDIAPGAYEVSAAIAPAAPRGAPPVRVRRSDSLGRPGDYAVDVGDLEKFMAASAAPAAVPAE